MIFIKCDKNHIFVPSFICVFFESSSNVSFLLSHFIMVVADRRACVLAGLWGRQRHRPGRSPAAQRQPHPSHQHLRTPCGDVRVGLRPREAERGTAARRKLLHAGWPLYRGIALLHTGHRDGQALQKHQSGMHKHVKHRGRVCHFQRLRACNLLF